MILGTTSIRLNRKQTDALRKWWDETLKEQSGRGVFALGQVSIKIGCYNAEPATATFALIDADGGKIVQEALNKAAAGPQKGENVT